MNANLFVIAVFVQGLFSQVALAQDTQGNEQPGAPIISAEEIVVIGYKNAEGKLYANMLKGLDAFSKHHGLAPNAELRFLLRPRGQAATLEGITVSISGESELIPVKVALDGTFSLPKIPSLADDDAELVLNRKRAKSFGGLMCAHPAQPKIRGALVIYDWSARWGGQLSASSNKGQTTFFS